MVSSKALLSGVSFQDVCDLAGWSSPYPFLRFYSLDVESTTGSQVLETQVLRSLQFTTFRQAFVQYGIVGVDVPNILRSVEFP